MRRIIVAIVVLGFLTSTAYAKQYKVGMIHWIAYSPLNVAEAKGLWKDQGLDVEVVNFGSNQELNAALENKRIDIALDMLGSWVGLTMSGTPIAILGETDWSNGGDKIIAKKGLDMAALKGQTVGIYLNQPSVTFFLNRFLAANGLKLADVKTVEVEPEAMADNFIAGKMPLTVNYDPQALRAIKEGDGTVVATSATYPGVIPEGFAARADTLADLPPADLTKLFAGWTKAVAWTKDPANWAEYVTILNAKTFEGEKPYSEAELKEMLAAVSIHDKATQLERNTVGLKAYMTELHAFLKDNNLLQADFAPDAIVQNTVLIESLKQ